MTKDCSWNYHENFKRSFHGNSMNNLFSYCGLIDAKIRAFDKDLPVQLNLCQKLLFLHQLTHNMMTNCLLFMKIVSSEYLQNMLCTQIVVFVLFCFDIQNNFGTQHVLQMLRASEKDLPVWNVYLLYYIHTRFWKDNQIYMQFEIVETLKGKSNWYFECYLAFSQHAIASSWGNVHKWF